MQVRHVQFLDHPYESTTIEKEMGKLKDAAVYQASRTAAVAALAFVYVDGIRYIFATKQFSNQKEAKYNIAEFAREKNAKFWIMAGVTEATNKFATQFKDYTLNIVGHFKEKVIYQKHTLLLSSGFFTVIASEENFSALDSEESEEGIKKIMEAESNENAFDVEGVEIAENPFA